MGISAHIHTKHIIEYEDAGKIRGHLSDCIKQWLSCNQVDVNWSSGDWSEDWEIEKSQLKEIGKRQYKNAELYIPFRDGFTLDDLKEFVNALIESKADEQYAYVSFF